MKNYFIYLLLFLLNVSCNRGEVTDDQVQDISKEGAMEVALSTKHLTDELDIVTIEYKVWHKNNLYKTVVKLDTVPSLGSQLTEDQDGYPIMVPKDYEFYVTVK